MVRPVVQIMSTPKRFFIDKLNYPEESEAKLSGEEFVHAKSVLRVGEGDEIILLDGSGREYSAIVTKIEKSCLSAHITGSFECDREPKANLYLLCGLLKGDKTELIIQKATELGARKIGVFSSEYCAAYMNENKLARLKKVAREGAKQCLRSRPPEIEYFCDLKSALASAKDYKNRFFACEFAKESEKSLWDIKDDCAVVVGSEGGFSDGEFALAREMGFNALSLGKRILRAETAAIAVCALAASSLGELG